MIRVRNVDHIGIRVANRARSEAFYAHLGFAFVFIGGTEPVVVLSNGDGVEINLIVNAVAHSAPNVLMDVAEKHAGYTHVALGVDSMEETVAELGRLGIAITDGPVKLGDRRSLFVRDPDRNVIELRERGSVRPATPPAT